jgi:hypothetical protein
VPKLGHDRHKKRRPNYVLYMYVAIPLETVTHVVWWHCCRRADRKPLTVGGSQ